ncbi:DUF6702 family protein [Winogradskyella sp.]|uniref:DUF6702 family protein n=1 Tax=Winogradskyella sp. TaxID=1883156 RepID=UPI00260E6D0C|nr:DUF6702 family protein [Winogradskyella sp.]
MKIKALIFIIAISSLKIINWEHPLKMSFSKLTISIEGQVDIESRIFLDDLTEHMEKLYGLHQADFSSTGSNGTQALQRYLRDHFYLEQSGKKLNLNIYNVSFSKNGLALVANMNVSGRLDVSKNLFLVNTLLCDASPMQVNDIKYHGEHFKLNIGNSKVKIQIK